MYKHLPHDLNPSAGEYGYHRSEGDGTVPLISLGYMCTHGWRGSLNPAAARVVTRDYKLTPISFSRAVMSEWWEGALQLTELARGGATAADHVDVMGNVELIRDILSIVVQRGDGAPAPPEQRILSRIENYSSRVRLG